MIEATIARKTSKKGNEYICVELIFPNGYKKVVFLDKAEEYMALQYLQ